jgi:RNA polymerase sigma-70 factor (ECF subfamily)
MLEQEIPRLRRYARALTRDSVQADDLVQSALTRALAKKHLWQPGTNLQHWLFTLLHHQRVSDVRRLIRDQRARADERVVSILPASPDPDARIALRELDHAIAALPEARRQVVLLIGLEEMTYGEAADILGVPLGTVRSRLSCARASLRKSLLVEAQIRKPVTAKDRARHERIAV